ncbi:MAG: DUF4438 domain-containing protein [Anaerolineales bacterium]|nr:DUF4438 domain-containing protein [Anaerolineales bacterium]
MLNTNRDHIVEFLMQCQPCPPRATLYWKIDTEGSPFMLPATGGITLNLQVGDPAFGWEGDHLEPGVSCTVDNKNPAVHPNLALQTFSCVGNKARIVSGDMKGAEGTVIGTHGGVEHLVVDFPREVKEKMTYDDKIIIHARGQGLKLLDYPDITLFNLDPDLLDRMKLSTASQGTLEVPVTTLVPPVCMGSGLGAQHVAKGDYDIMTSDPDTVEEYKLDQLRFGDFVALIDHDNRYGRAFRKGAMSIGVIVHSDCKKSGHGPGVTTIMTAAQPRIKPALNPKANLADLLQIGTTI